MKERFETAKKHIKGWMKKNDDLAVGIGVLAFAACIGLLIFLVIRSQQPNIVYEPVNACDLFTPEEAQELLDDDVHRVNTQKPQIMKDQTATSKCSYGNMKGATSDPENMRIAAVAIRSGFNDEGVAKNKSDYQLMKKSVPGEPVENLGDDAFYTKANGQLNILDGRMWIILSHGIASTPEKNKLKDLLKLADLILEHKESN